VQVRLVVASFILLLPLRLRIKMLRLWFISRIRVPTSSLSGVLHPLVLIVGLRYRHARMLMNLLRALVILFAG
jgi:hypothetical protein